MNSKMLFKTNDRMDALSLLQGGGGWGKSMLPLIDLLC